MPTHEPPPSAKLIGRREAKIVYNRAALEALHEGIADAVEEVMARIRDEYAASAPRDPEKAAERGVPMMADTARISVFAMGKLVSGTGEWMASRNKPRNARTPADQVVGFVMVDSPLAHLVELGTVKMNARPALITAFNRNIGGLASTVVPAMGKRLAGSAQSVFARVPRARP